MTCLAAEIPLAVALNPAELLDHAQEMANHHDGRGRPRPIWLRRAVSAAYYAAFHAIGLAVTAQLAPHASDADRYRLCRSIDHRALADVSAWVRGQRGNGSRKQHVQAIVTELRSDEAISDLAGDLSALQAARHRADYDHLYILDKATALTHVAQAQRVLRLLDQHTGEPNLERFLALLALHTQRL